MRWVQLCGSLSILYRIPNPGSLTPEACFSHWYRPPPGIPCVPGPILRALHPLPLMLPATLMLNGISSGPSVCIGVSTPARLLVILYRPCHVHVGCLVHPQPLPMWCQEFHAQLWQLKMSPEIAKHPQEGQNCPHLGTTGLNYQQSHLLFCFMALSHSLYVHIYIWKIVEVQ